MIRKQENGEVISLNTVRYGLGYLWFIGAGIIAAVLIVQTLFNHYGTDAKKYWDWYTPLVTPTLLTMIGVLAGSALGSTKDQSVNRRFYRIVCGLSVAYLLMIAAPIIAQPVSPRHWEDMLNDSNYWLSIIKGLVTGAIGCLFASKQKTEDPKSTAPAAPSAEKLAAAD